MSKLSIITINYNNLDGLKRTVKSVVNQTWQEFEYIIIDGGSTDGSLDYIESQDEYIDYWVSEPDKGIYNAMNKGIVKATGEYLLFLNSGDCFFADEVLTQNNKFLIEKDLIYFNVEIVNNTSSEIIVYPEKLNFSLFYLRTLCHQSTFIKKALFDELGFYDEDLKIVSDWKFFILALFKYNCSYRKVNDILVKFYMDGISSNNIKLANEERQKVLNDYFPEYLRLFELERFLKDIKKSKTIRFIKKFGLLKFVDRIH